MSFCNISVVPFIFCRHSDELIERLENAGLGYHVDADKTVDKLGKNKSYVMVHVQSPTWILSDAPHSPPSTPPPPPPTLLLLPPHVQPPVPAFGPLEAMWPLCSWHHGVWRVRTPARGKGLMTSCQPVGPRGPLRNRLVII